MSGKMTRRGALQALAAPFVLSAASGGARGKAPSDTLNIAAIGVARRGGANVSGVRHENLVALCDVDANHLGRAKKQFPKAKTFTDFRRMLDTMGKEIDAVVVSTPDHTHAPAAAMAMRMGKHCYCEKPLTHSVHECRMLIELSRQHKLVTQMGTQIHAGDNYRRVVEIVQAGVVGAIQEVHVWCSVRYGGVKRPADTPPVPKHLNWDLWLGQAPQRPYHPTYVPGRWRNWWDFGGGGIGDFGCHYMDLPFWALKLRHPTSVEAEGPPAVDAESVPRWLKVQYEFPARGALPPVAMTWYDGGKQPAMLKDVLPANRRKGWSSGVLFVGSKGQVLANYGSRMVLPTKTFASVAPPKQTIPRSIGHHREWTEACKNGGPTTCNFDYSGTLAEAVLLGNAAYRAGEKLQWDGANLKVTNTTKADRFLRRPYREGWKL